MSSNVKCQSCSNAFKKRNNRHLYCDQCAFTRIRKNQSQYKKKNSERIKQYNKDYYKENHQKIKEKNVLGRPLKKDKSYKNARN